MTISHLKLEDVETVVRYLRDNDLYLATAESCTAGLIAAALGAVPGGGKIMESGYVVYSPQAKQRLLSVSPETISRYGLTSEEVAREMAMGALHDSEANVAVATTGVAGPEPMDDIEPGTVCLAWAFTVEGSSRVFSRTEHYSGDRQEVMCRASGAALAGIALWHDKARQKGA